METDGTEPFDGTESIEILLYLVARRRLTWFSPGWHHFFSSLLF
jgi:hypothetical protein